MHASQHQLSRQLQRSNNLTLDAARERRGGSLALKASHLNRKPKQCSSGIVTRGSKHRFRAEFLKPTGGFRESATTVLQRGLAGSVVGPRSCRAERCERGLSNQFRAVKCLLHLGTAGTASAAAHVKYDSITAGASLPLPTVNPFTPFSCYQSIRSLC